MIDLTIETQPDDETCGATCLHALYQYYGWQESLIDVIKTVERSLSGGTLAPFLGIHALKRNFNAIIYVNNLDVFDPTWFDHGRGSNDILISKLTEQLEYKDNVHIVQSSNAYINFLRAGGEIRFETIQVNLLKEFFKKSIPVLTGLSATYLYRSARERFIGNRSFYDDVQGTPCGHFVLLCGYDDTHRHVIVADPHCSNPISHDNYYKVSINRLINAIMLGVYTYDANLLTIVPDNNNYANHSSNR